MRTKTTVVTCLVLAAGSLGCLIGGVTEGLRYSSWGDPGALTIGLRLLLAGVVLAVLVAVLVFAAAVRSIRRKGTRLSAGQVAAGAAALGVADYYWHEHNVREAARLTESVMGPERTGESPWA